MIPINKKPVTSAYRFCNACDDAFVAQVSNQVYCGNCRPVCRGCGYKFDPINRAVQICDSCISKIKIGECTSCGVAFYPNRYSTFNHFGHCEDCQNEEERYRVIDSHYKCIDCGNTLSGTDAKFRICSNCRAKTNTCPYCSENHKSQAEFMCLKCDTAAKKEWNRKMNEK